MQVRAVSGALRPAARDVEYVVDRLEAQAAVWRGMLLALRAFSDRRDRLLLELMEAGTVRMEEGNDDVEA